VRENLETFEVENPKEAMEKFKSALAQVVRVPKAVVERKRKRAKAKYKRKRKS
jgi:hypothetical protein